MLLLPPGRDRRRDKHRRIRTGYSSLRVTNVTQALMRELADAIGAACVDEALFYLAANQLGFVRAAAIVAASQSAQEARSGAGRVVTGIGA